LPPDPTRFSVRHLPESPLLSSAAREEGIVNGADPAVAGAGQAGGIANKNVPHPDEGTSPALMDTQAASGGLPESFKDLKLEHIRVSQCYGINYNRTLDIVSHDAKVTSLQTSSKANIVYNCLRVEPIVDTREANTIDILCYHAERQGSAFGHPMWLQVRQGDTVPILKEKIQKKLVVPNQDYRNWRICRVDSPNDAFPARNVLRDDENAADLWSFVTGPHAKLWLEHSHPTLRLGDQTPKPRAKPRGLVIK